MRPGFWPLNKLKNFDSKYVGSKKISNEIFEKIIVYHPILILNQKIFYTLKN